MIALAMLLQAAMPAPVDIPAGGASGAPYGFTLYFTPMQGAPAQEIEGTTLVIYDFLPSWALLFPPGFKPAQPYELTPRDVKRIRRANRDHAKGVR